MTQHFFETTVPTSPLRHAARAKWPIGIANFILGAAKVLNCRLCLKSVPCNRVTSLFFYWRGCDHSSLATPSPAQAIAFPAPATPLASSYSLATNAPHLPGYKATSLSVLQVCDTPVGKNASFTDS